MNPAQVARCIGFSYEDQLKKKDLPMDFAWIERAVRDLGYDFMK